MQATAFIPSAAHIAAMRVCDAWDALCEATSDKAGERPAAVAAAIETLAACEESDLDAIRAAAAPVERPTPFALSPESAADLVELTASDNPHVSHLARNIRDWLTGKDYAPAAVIASASVISNNFALRMAAGDGARELIGKMAKSAADVAGSMNADALAVAGFEPAKDFVGSFNDLAAGLESMDWPKIYNAMTHLMRDARRLADAGATIRASNTTLTGSLAQSDSRFVERAAAWRQAAALSQADKTQLRGSAFAAARICARYLDALCNRGDPADLASLADAICELERRASEKHNEAREATESLHRKTQSLTDSRAIVERLTGEVATYRAQRDSEGARAASYKAAWDRLAKALSGMTLGQLPADSYGADVAASYLAGKRDLTEAGL